MRRRLNLAECGELRRKLPFSRREGFNDGADGCLVLFKWLGLAEAIAIFNCRQAQLRTHKRTLLIEHC